MRWVREHGWLRIEVESDAANIVQALQRTDATLAEEGAIIEECRDLAKNFLHCSFFYVHRSGNFIAHKLALRALSFPADGVGPPDFVSMILSQIQLN